MRFVLPLALTFFIALTIAEYPPVFIWGANIVQKPSIPIVSREEFSEQVRNSLKKKALVVVLENNLGTKDFLCTDDNGTSCYPGLQSMSNITYYAAVDDPIEALQTIGGVDYNSVDNNSKFSKQLETDAGKITFLRFDDEQSQNMVSKLKQHDAIMHNITSIVGENVFIMYTSSPSTSSLKRQRRQVSQDNTNGYYFRDKENLLIFYKSISIIEDNNPPKLLEMKEFECKLDNATSMSVTLTPTNGSPLTFDITLAGGYFFMKNVKYNNVKLLSSDVYAPTDFSYFCGNLSLSNIPNEKEPVRYTLKWNYLQFQAPFGTTNDTSFAFGDAWHCVGFFTGGILSGLLIVALLLTITFIGVCWMMDINTMDRFDDPKGKTITINASD